MKGHKFSKRIRVSAPVKLSKGVKSILYAAGIMVLIVLLIETLSFSKNLTTDDIPFNQRFKVYDVPLPDTMNFAGEEVPMNHLGVKEGMEQEILVNTYWQSQSLLMLKRSSRYFPVIERVLKKYSIPDDFKFLAMAESGFGYKVSPAGAAGFWQLMKSTALAYNLKINKEVDERYNLERSTEAACSYFKDAYDVFHNWTLVAASYNMGIEGLRKDVERERESNYYNLSLNLETSRYIYRILALKQLTAHPDWYGYYLNKADYYQPLPTYTITVDSTVVLASLAENYGINFHTLKFFNPWLMSDKLNNTGGTEYVITLPRKNVPFEELGEDIVYNDSLESVQPLNTGGNAKTEVEIDSAKVTPAQCSVKSITGASTPDTSEPKIIVHIVQSGETIECLAEKFRVTVDQIRAWNNISDTLIIKPGDELMMFVK